MFWGVFVASDTGCLESVWALIKILKPLRHFRVKCFVQCQKVGLSCRSSVLQQDNDTKYRVEYKKVCLMYEEKIKKNN